MERLLETTGVMLFFEDFIVIGRDDYDFLQKLRSVLNNNNLYSL